MDNTDLETEQNAVDAAFESFLNHLTSIENSVREKWDNWKLHQALLEQKLDECASMSEKPVVLNIGGDVFKTTEATLLQEKESFFWAMLHSGRFLPDSQGHYFIDRSPVTFNVLLQYLRSGKLPVSDLTTQQQEMLEEDVDFYQIRSLLNPTQSPLPILWDDVPQKWQGVLKLSGGATTLETLTPNAIHTASFPTPIGLQQRAVHRWKVTVMPGVGCRVGIGDIRKPSWETSVTVGMSGGQLFRIGGKTTPFVQWPRGCSHTTAEFEYNTTTRVLVIKAMDKTTDVELPPPKAGCRWGPVAGCQGLSKTPHKFIICALHTHPQSTVSP
eukprot:TRINITY_DN113709_c0_g1_i1.p1 TRINITY_DN113709_c0_g1~~TRINITY_DN113709_c0_g1_i1.p1  ORF type:complete len:328 (-),score=21.51 TRINITY_DN113709_c0_g1_i1:110-1093(-)